MRSFLTFFSPISGLWGVLLPFCLWAQNSTTHTPNAFLPHALGEQFTPHHLLVDYYQYLAAQQPQHMRLERYGSTYEDRPLQVAYFSSPENMARLEQIQSNNVRLAGLGNRAGVMDSAVAIVWLSMSVHGNEPSGAECGMELAYRLATQTDPTIRKWLKNTLVIIDPSLNPDGYDRYTHWHRMAANNRKTPNPDSREHHEPWPGGRPNHYYFDLNRDWAWATQRETQARLSIFQRWLPHIHADLHEQGPDDPYYFAPAAEPMHAYITPWQREFQDKIGKNHARYFDEKDWLYFRKEVFDLLYPSYGDTYPMFNGSIGMTYEQGGLSTAGRALIISNGDTLTLHDRIAHHLTTSLSTIEMASNNARQVVERFRDFYSRSAQTPQGQYVTFVVRASNEPNRVRQLCELLDRHQIRYGLAGKLSTALRAFDYQTGSEASATVQPNDLVISAYQPKSVLIQVLFEPETKLSDSLTYDITAWALPFAYGLEALALKTRLDPTAPYVPYRAPTLVEVPKTYAWCAHRRSLSDVRWAFSLLQKGVKMRYATRGFELGGQQFMPGTFVVTRNDNSLGKEALDALMRESAAAANVTLFPMSTGMAEQGPDLGSDAYRLISNPEVAMIYDEEVDENAYGHLWHFFEQELDYPITLLPLSKLQRVNLHEYTTLILPNGYYTLSEPMVQQLKAWVRTGGRVIVLENAVRLFAGRDDFDLKIRPEPKRDSVNAIHKPYQVREREALSEQLPGAILKAKVDHTHPLGYGLGNHYFTLKSGNTVFDMPTQANTAIWVADKYQSYGFIGGRLRPRLENTPLAVSQRMDRGEFVYFVDHPLFRSFWQTGKLVMSNALLH